MKARLVGVLLAAIVLASCSAEGARRLQSDPAPTPSPVIVYVTPTAVPTFVPTVARARPTVTQTESDQAVVSLIEPADCEDVLQAQFTASSDLCLEAPDGSFCSGGLPPSVEPASGGFSAPGAVVEAAKIDSLHNPRLGDARGAGLVWLRLEKELQLDALLIGELRITNRTPAVSVYPKWRFIAVESGETEAGCEAAPQTGALILQSVYGESAELNINGVVTVINGTLVVMTEADMTRFIAIEGQSRLNAFGQTVFVDVGQQLNLQYDSGDWTRPIQLPGSPVRLTYDLIEHLPIALFDRPVPIPQPGYARTQGGVNMRAAPDVESLLLYRVPAGETMSVLGISRDQQWLHIRLGNGETGWMSAALLERNLGEIGPIYDLTPQPPQRLGAYADLASVNVPAGGNLREAPDTAFRIVRGLPFGMQVQLLARSPYSPWVKVNADGNIGWMALFTLTTKSVISSLPIDYNVPLPPLAQAKPTATPASSFFGYGGGHAYPDPAGGY